MGFSDIFKRVLRDDDLPELPDPARIRAEIIKNGRHIREFNKGQFSAGLPAYYDVTPYRVCREPLRKKICTEEECFNRALSICTACDEPDMAAFFAVTAVMILMQYSYDPELNAKDYYFNATRLLAAETLTGVFYLMSCLAVDKAEKKDKFHGAVRMKAILKQSLQRIINYIEDENGLGLESPGAALVKDRFLRYGAIVEKYGVVRTAHAFHSFLIIDITEGTFVKAGDTGGFDYSGFKNDDVLAAEVTALIKDLESMSDYTVKCALSFCN